MARTVTIPATEVTEELNGISHYPGELIHFQVGRGRVINGQFAFDVPQQFEQLRITEGLYQDFIAAHPTGFVPDDLWDYVDILRSGADSTRPSPYHTWDRDALIWVEPADYLDRLKDDTVKAINAKTQEKIYSFAPQYKQANLTARYIEIKELEPTLELEVEAAEIKAVWERVKAIRALSNSTNTAITSASTANEVTTAKAEFTTALEAL